MVSSHPAGIGFCFSADLGPSASTLSGQLFVCNRHLGNPDQRALSGPHSTAPSSSKLPASTIVVDCGCISFLSLLHGFILYVIYFLDTKTSMQHYFYWPLQRPDFIRSIALLHFVISSATRPIFRNYARLPYAKYFIANPAPGTTLAIALLSDVSTVGQLSWASLWSFAATLVGFFMVDSSLANSRWIFVLGAGVVLWSRALASQVSFYRESVDNAMITLGLQWLRMLWCGLGSLVLSVFAIREVFPEIIEQIRRLVMNVLNRLWKQCW